MPFKSASSTIALTAAAAFALSTSAFAQTVVGSQEVSEEDMTRVMQHCQTLTEGAGAGATDDAVGTAAEGGVGGTEMGGAATGAEGETGSLNAGGTAEGTEASPETDAEVGDAVTTDAGRDTLDLAAITAEDCEAAEFGDQ
jgi:hypothetical protein